MAPGWFLRCAGAVLALGSASFALPMTTASAAVSQEVQVDGPRVIPLPVPTDGPLPVPGSMPLPPPASGPVPLPTSIPVPLPNTPPPPAGSPPLTTPVRAAPSARPRANPSPAPSASTAKGAPAPADVRSPGADGVVSRRPAAVGRAQSVHRSFAGTVAAGTRATAFPVLLLAVLVGFLAVQRWIDRADPQLDGRASGPDRDLRFE